MNYIIGDIIEEVDEEIYQIMKETNTKKNAIPSDYDDTGVRSVEDNELYKKLKKDA
jgi:hypothetical protein